MKAFRSATILAAIVVAVLSEPSNSVRQRVTILKCCRHKEGLARRSDGDPYASARCEATANEWKPFIYSPSLQIKLLNPPAEWDIVEGRKPECGDNSVLTYVPYRSTNPVVLLDDGRAILDVNADDKAEPGEYCADSNAFLVCVRKRMEGHHAAATMRPRVRQCCGHDAAFHEEIHACADLKEGAIETPLLPNASSSVEIVPGFPTCPRFDNFTILGDAKDAVLLPDGGLEIDGVTLPTGQFCVERIKELNQVAKVFACWEHASQRPVVQTADIRFTLYPVGFIISAVFLAATLAAGWLLPASHHVLHWRCQTHHVACLMLGDLLMAIIQLAGDSLHGGSCEVLAIMAHFFFLAAFFWLNTMCFNIWWTFRDLRPASLEKGQETLRLRVYAAYAWGGPFLVAGVAALLDHLPSHPQYTFLRPRFGEKQCWFYGDMEILAYFYGPVGVLLAVNLLFFAATARELTCGLWKGEFVKSTTERWSCIFKAQGWQSRVGPRLHEAGGRDGHHLGGGRGLVGSRRPPVHLVLHRHDKRLPGRADLRGGWLPAAGTRRAQEDLQQEPEGQRRTAGERAQHHQPRDAQHGRQRHTESKHEDRPVGNHLLSQGSIADARRAGSSVSSVPDSLPVNEHQQGSDGRDAELVRGMVCLKGIIDLGSLDGAYARRLPPS